MIKETMAYLSQYDPEVGATIENEYHREQRNIELIASENIVSPAVMLAMGTCLTNKYAEGYPGKRYYGGCYCVDETEEIARQRACKLFGAEHASTSPVSISIRSPTPSTMRPSRSTTTSSIASRRSASPR